MSAAKSNLAEVKAMLLDMAAEARNLEQAAGGSITDTVTGWLAPQYAVTARKKLAATDGLGRFEVWRTFVQDWAMLLNARSHGRYFHAHIKNRYVCRKISHE